VSEEILININSKETRVAIIEEGVLQEIHIERHQHRGLVGNIYVGKVVRVLPGMQAAFVDLGLQRAAFLHASDLIHSFDSEELDEPAPPVPAIDELVVEGQELVVQVLKDPMGTKGARLTTRLSIPSRYLVYMPGLKHIGISARIEDESERERLRDILDTAVPACEGGFIIRTAAEGVSREDILMNRQYVLKLWDSISQKMRTANFGARIYEDLPILVRALRDFVTPKIERVRIDDGEALVRAQAFSAEFIPHIVGKIELYDSARPLFDLFNVEEEIERALSRKVLLKSGGHLMFDQTEAMTTIDVNTGGFVGHRSVDETIFKTNLEAVQAITRQLRLRNLGGIIIIDFIDMNHDTHKEEVMKALQLALDHDYAKTMVSSVSDLGLVEMTRKRTRESLEHVLCEACPTCQNRGTIKSAETVCSEIIREILRNARNYTASQYLVLASQAVVDRLLDEEAALVAEIEMTLGKSLRFQVEASYTQEQFDVVLT